jgi:hypothetical protein
LAGFANRWLAESFICNKTVLSGKSYNIFWGGYKGWLAQGSGPVCGSNPAYSSGLSTVLVEGLKSGKELSLALDYHPVEQGEYATRTEAKRLLPVGEIVADDNWYDHLKLFAAFCVRIGCRGFLVFVDEGVNLYKIANRRSRENNYEKLLSIFNDIMQGKAQWMGFYMGGPPQFLEDERRGLASYPALKSRLEESRFVRSGHVDSGSPVIRLSPLANEEVFILLERLTEIHALHYGYEPWIGEEEITAFLELALSSPGATEFITPREITRDYLALLNILKDEPEEDFFELIRREDRRVKAASPEELYAQFQV